MPSGATTDASLLLETRGLRALGDGLVSIVLAAYLSAVGLSDVRIGIVVTATLLGSAALTLAVGLRAHAYPRRRLLRLVSLLMIATGIGFAVFTNFWPFALIGLIGTMNPSGGDVSVFLPTEQALLPATVPDSQRTALFARYSLIGTLLAAVGAALAFLPGWVSRRFDVDDITALRFAFVRVCVDRRHRAHPLSASVAGGRTGADRRAGASRPRAVEVDRLPARRVVQPRRVRRRLRDHGHARASGCNVVSTCRWG